MNLIKDNYLRGSGNGKYWHVDIDPPKGKVKSYHEETLETARYVYENKQGKIHLLYSGGLDSQYVFNVLHSLKMDFVPVIIRVQGRGMIHDYNHEESKYAFEHCKCLGIKPKVIVFDFDPFFESGELIELADQFECGSWMIPATMKVAKELDEFIVMGNDPPYLKYFQDTDSWCLEELEIIHSILRFFHRFEVPGCPFFLSYRAEQMLSFLLDPTIVDLANGKYPGKLGTNSSKCHVFNNGSGFNMVNYDWKTRKKMTGYEEFLNTDLGKSYMMDHFQAWKLQYYGGYYEDYHRVVERLCINQ